VDQQFHSTVNIFRCATNKFAIDASEESNVYFQNITHVDCVNNASGLIGNNSFLNISSEGSRSL